MHLTIHRGTKEIGGSCIELTSANSRILIDFGLPLVDESGNQFNSDIYRKKTREELIAQKLLPSVEGLYKDELPLYDAVLISHAHPDHFGLLNFINPKIPVYMSEGTKILIEIANFFDQVDCKLDNVKTVPAWKDFTIGDFKIHPYLIDHSSFNAFSYLIEAENKRLFYTGDFRGHGRIKKTFENIIENPPKNIDYLIMEGTTIGRDQAEYKTEEDIENEIINIVKDKEELYFVSCSSQNIDRIVSIYKACMRTDCIFVIDPYTAMVLDRLRELSPNIPQFNWGETMKVYFAPNSYSKKMQEKGELLYRYTDGKIEIEDIIKNRHKMLIKDASLTRDSMLKRINPEESKLIYSLWEGYLPNIEEKWLKHKVPIVKLHTSGHAYVEDLQKLVDALKPAKIIPIHTFNPEKYSGLFGSNILLLEDNQTVNL